MEVSGAPAKVLVGHLRRDEDHARKRGAARIDECQWSHVRPVRCIAAAEGGLRISSACAFGSHIAMWFQAACCRAPSSQGWQVLALAYRRR